MAVCCICPFFDSLADVCRKGTMMVEEKLDRRSAYSRMVIEDTFLEMLREGPFSRINVAGLCRRADISRGTFYLHYVDIYDVLNHVLAKALMTAEQEGERESFLSFLKLSKEENIREKLRENGFLLPVCQRMADDEKYRPLFQDESISSHVLHFVYSAEREKIVPLMMKYYGVKKKVAEMMYLFTVAGAYAVNRDHKWKKDEDWYEFQEEIIRMLGK